MRGRGRERWGVKAEEAFIITRGSGDINRLMTQLSCKRGYGITKEQERISFEEKKSASPCRDLVPRE